MNELDHVSPKNIMKVIKHMYFKKIGKSTLACYDPENRPQCFLKTLKYDQNWAKNDPENGIRKSMIFEVFWEYLGEFFIFLRKIFFGSKILSICCDNHQNFDSGWSSYPGNEAQSLDFAVFWWFLGIFRAVCFDTSLLPRTRKIGSMYHNASNKRPGAS